MGKVYHVAVNGKDCADGTLQEPFRTISRAAAIVEAGDKVIVHGGEYREWVKPEHGGLNDDVRIVYETAEGEKVVIKGSERIQTWERCDKGVWKAIVPNALFGDYNPYKEPLWGDWFIYPEDGYVHAGDVYLNGKSFFEARTLDEVYNPAIRTDEKKPWYPEESIYKWHAIVEKERTIIYANFQEWNPNQELVEINVRKCCFFPEKSGRNYITVRGFEMAQAASPWVPPTAYQQGLLGTNWSKGWIIENNRIHDAKCSGISIGKNEIGGHNLCSAKHMKAGYQYQMEAVFHALKSGWSKERIGSHIIRNNEIYDCGQNGIVGHMGCIFSEIHDNHIYRIGIKREFFGWEVAGVKLHAAIDVQVYRNSIHHCVLGVWFDWQAQGIRVSRNLFYANERDAMFEVTHGPHMVDNNVFASDFNLDNSAQGGAYINNLFCGALCRNAVLNRATPYHFPHSTQVAGVTFVYGGDDRFHGNIFGGCMLPDREGCFCGTAGYNGCLTTWDEYTTEVMALGSGDLENFERVPQAVFIRQNVYFYGALAFQGEEEKYVSSKKLPVSIWEDNGTVWLEIDVEDSFYEFSSGVVDSEQLGKVRIVEMPYESPSGYPVILDTDFLGEKRNDNSPAGPFAHLHKGKNRIKIWVRK